MVLGHRKHSLSSNRSSSEDPRQSYDSAGEDETVVDSEQNNLLLHIISQLRPGADLSRVTLPTFILEPRSMLERITNFMAHPELLLPIPEIEDTHRRFVSVVKFYLSGWHIRPSGVKKPLNPILGETFQGYWDYPDGTQGYYISEQTSHHPPKSSYFFMAPEHQIRIDGTLKPRSKFLGNSAASMMEGIAVMRFLNRGERYFITQPNIYSRGILFGKMKYELGDRAYVKCPESGLAVDIEFKVKGWVGGTYNAIGGFIQDTKSGKNLYELSGIWTGEMFIKDLANGKKQLLFDATHARETPPKSRPLGEQGERESQRLWDQVTTAIKKRDQDTATEEKTRIEDMQRDEAAKRAEQGQEFQPRLFKRAPAGDEQDLDWIVDAKVDASTPNEQIKQILSIAPIIPGQKPEASRSLSQKASLPSQHVPPPQHPSSTNNDLIDFGQNDPSQQPSTQQMQNLSIEEGNQGLMRPLQPKEAVPGGGRMGVARKDSENGLVDQFVDAES